MEFNVDCKSLSLKAAATGLVRDIDLLGMGEATRGVAALMLPKAFVRSMLSSGWIGEAITEAVWVYIGLEIETGDWKASAL